MSASIRRNDEEPGRERPAEEGEQAQRPLPPPEDYVRQVRELHEVALARSELEELADALTAGAGVGDLQPQPPGGHRRRAGQTRPAHRGLRGTGAGDSGTGGDAGAGRVAELMYPV